MGELPGALETCVLWLPAVLVWHDQRPDALGGKCLLPEVLVLCPLGDEDNGIMLPRSAGHTNDF